MNSISRPVVEQTISVADVGTLVSALVAAVGVLIIIQQLRAYKQFSRSQLISELVRDFEPHLKLQGKLMRGGDLVGCANLEAEEEGTKLMVFSYLGFFEKIYFLVKNRAVKIESIGELFLFRFLIAMHCSAIQEFILYDRVYGPRFAAVVRLYQQLIYHFAEQNRDWPDIGSRLDLEKCHIQGSDWPQSID